MFFQNPQRIAARNTGVLAGVAGQDDAGTVPDSEGEQPFHVVDAHDVVFDDIANPCQLLRTYHSG